MGANGQVMQVPGSLYLDPTGTGTASRGTYLGETDAGYAIRFERHQFELTLHEYGNAVQDVREINCGASIRVGLLRMNSSTKKMLVGSSRVTGELVEIPGDFTPGASSDTHKILFVPTNTTQGVAFYAPRGVPRAAGEVAFMLDDVTVADIEIVCTPAEGTAHGRTLQWGPITSISI